MGNDASSHHVYTHPSGVEHWRHLVEIVALIIAAAWAFYVFVYQERLKPASETPNIDFSVQVQHDNLVDNKELVTIRTAWHNKGSVPVHIDGIVMNVYGVRYFGGGGRLSSVPTNEQLRPGTNKIVLDSRAMIARQRLLRVEFVPWRPMGGQFVLAINPGDIVAPTADLVIPRGVYEAVSVWYAYCARRADDSRSAMILPPRNADGSFDIFSVPRLEQKAFGPDQHCEYWPGEIYAL